MIKAVLFDFGQTLVDSGNGFRAAEKEVQTRIFSGLSLTSWETFLSNYRRIRKEFHSRSQFSRKSIWQELYFYYCLSPDLTRLESLSITPEEVVYVGDDWRIDICGAKDVGIQPIWLQHHSVNRNWPAVETSVPIITSLDRLLDLEHVLS